MQPLRARWTVEALHVRLRQRLAELHLPSTSVADVTRLFLEISSLECEPGLWSLEFAFDEDDGRVARLEARFWEPSDTERAVVDALPGYEVQLTLPRVFPLRTPAERTKAAEKVLGVETSSESVVARFVRALTDLGAYRMIEPHEVRAADVHLL